MRLGDTELCWMDAGSPPGLGKVQREHQCPSNRHGSMPVPMEPQHPADKQWPKPPPHCEHQATGFTNRLCP